MFSRILKDLDVEIDTGMPTQAQKQFAKWEHLEHRLLAAARSSRQATV